MQPKRKIIIITDGDKVAKKSVEKVAQKIGGRCISLSAGNPTLLSGNEIADLVLQAPYDPVLVMIDDKGYIGTGPGESALEDLIKHPEIEVLGAVAVASNTTHAKGIEVDFSITNTGKKIKGAVDKEGKPVKRELTGDTVECLNRLKIPHIIGIGDVGKMDGTDRPERGVPITTKAVEEILNRSGYYDGSSR
ncbi:MAG: stage sporulation protein [Clostridia bacterium]|jgi:stage V sporulation protein AE|nr:stage sporulation protein [Clostridia bacterium]